MALLAMVASATTERSAPFVDPLSVTAAVADRSDKQTASDARRLAAIPTAAWFTDGTPAEVEARVRSLVTRAAAAGAIPVLVAYNIPFRDCALYSAGGAASGAQYLAWIKGFAAGIGDRPAIVVLEPDGLGVVPWMRRLDGGLEGCRPMGLDPAAATERFEQVRAAVAVLAALPRARIYLDGTTSSWLAPGEIAARLVRADVGRVAGFFLNVSNFESDARLAAYARAVSDCIALISRAGIAPQRCPAAEATTVRTLRAYDRLFADAGLRRDPAHQKHAILDTSRNGRGSWVPPAGKYADAEVWCNPPGRGLGRRPTLKSDDPYVDAYLWIKIPGESDGECRRGGAGLEDPERGVRLPPAGHWYPEAARELIRNAVPPLKR
ncbi:glycoside hydrolase family 6 protein [Sphingomonas floccifaciens]